MPAFSVDPFVLQCWLAAASAPMLLQTWLLLGGKKYLKKRIFASTSSNSKAMSNLCDALEINAKCCTRFSLDFTAGSIAKLDAQFYITEDQINELADWVRKNPSIEKKADVVQI